MTEIQKILHLHRRAGFGLSPDQLGTVSRSRLTDEVDRVLAQAETGPLLRQIDLGFMQKTPQERNVERDAFLRSSGMAVWDKALEWMNLIGNPQVSGLREKMTLFWHGHFATRIRFAHSAVNQNNLLRQNGTGNFRDLLFGMAKDPAMIEFLNNNGNRKGAINENFGRELLELFTLGIGNYSQKDIYEASRAFSGWSHLEHNEFTFTEFFHDPGEKVFLGKKGPFKGEDILQILLEQKQTARFICTKLLRFFHSPNPRPEQVEALAEVMFKSKFEIQPVLRAMFTAPWFYEGGTAGTLVKSPVELLGGMMRVLGIQLQGAEGFFRLSEQLGQTLFSPPNVAGWPGGEQWISHATLYRRLNLAYYLGQSLPGVSPEVTQTFEVSTKDLIQKGLTFTFQPEPLRARFAKTKTPRLFSSLAGYLLAAPMPSSLPARRAFPRRSDEIVAATLFLMGLPEYQVV